MRVPPGPNADPGAQENGGPGYDCSSRGQLRALGRQASARACSAARSPTSWTLRTSGSPAPGSGSRSTPAPPAGKGTRSSRSPGSCSTPSTARRPPRPAPARAGSPPPRSPTSSPAARSSPDTPKACDPPALPTRRRRAVCWLSPAAAARTRHSSTTSGATRRASTTHASAGRRRARCGAQFAAAYVRFLDGAGTASGLPDATPSVRALAAQAGSIPAARRRGTLVMTQLRPAVGERGAATCLTARDDAHTFYAQMTLAEQRGRWLVVELTPPDFVQAFAPPGPPPPAPPRGSAARRARRPAVPARLSAVAVRAGAARARSPARRAGLLAGLKAHPPRVPPTMQLAATRRSPRSRCSATAAAGRRSRTSPTAARPTSSCSRSRRRAAAGSSATSAPR